MSIERVPDGESDKRWRVRWRDEEGKERSRRVRTKRQAEWLDGEIKRRKIGGELIALERRSETLDDFFEERWWPQYAVPSLADNTRDTKRSNWRCQISPALGSVPLKDLSVEMVDRFKVGLVELAPAYQRTILGTLHEVVQKASEWGYIRENPVSKVRRPSGERTREVVPMVPEEIEAIRAELPRQHRIIVSLMAYGGLRPGEVRRLRWEHVRDRTLYLPEEITKGLTPARTVQLWRPLAEDLAEWGEHSDGELVRPNRNGHQLSAASWKQWQTNVFKPVAGTRAYDLRHSFVSLLIQAGTQILEVARQAGHSPTLTLKRYGHLFDELDPREPTDPEELIYRARGGRLKDRISAGAIASLALCGYFGVGSVGLL